MGQMLQSIIRHWPSSMVTISSPNTSVSDYGGASVSTFTSTVYCRGCVQEKGGDLVVNFGQEHQLYNAVAYIPGVYSVYGGSKLTHNTSIFTVLANENSAGLSEFQKLYLRRISQ